MYLVIVSDDGIEWKYENAHTQALFALNEAAAYNNNGARAIVATMNQEDANDFAHYVVTGATH